MRIGILSFVLLVLCAASAWSDNIINVPRGTTLTTGQFRGQAMFSASGDEGNFFSTAIGLKQLELGYIHAEYPNGRQEELVSAQWNVLPETFITPAIGIGVRDIGSQSTEGIGFYGSITKHIPIQNYTKYVDDFSVTFGMGSKSVKGFFCGAEVKLPLYFVGQLEYDGDYWNSALSWQPVETFRLKLYRIGYEHYFGAEFVPLEF